MNVRFRAANGRVEMWRGGFRFGVVCCRPFRLAVPEQPIHRSVSTSRSSNRTCRFPASGSRTRHIPSHTKGHSQFTDPPHRAVRLQRKSSQRLTDNHQCDRLGRHSLPGSQSGSFFTSACSTCRRSHTLTEFPRVAPISCTLRLSMPVLN